MRIMLLGLLLLLSGCAHTFVIEKGAPPEKFAAAQAFLHQKPAKLVLKTDKRFRATDLHIGPDSTVFRIDGATDRIVVMNDRIRSIATQDVRKGTRAGVIAGGITGSFLGLIIGGMVAAIDPEYRYDTYYNGEEYSHVEEENDVAVVFEGIGIGALIGTVMGGLIGSQSGSIHCVEFYRDPKDPQRWEYLPR